MEGDQGQLLKTVSLYKEHSSLREWRSEDRKFFQTLTWMDVGEKTPHLHRLQQPKERFASFEEERERAMRKPSEDTAMDYI